MLKIGDKCHDAMARFGIDEWHARITVTRADNTSVVLIDGGQLTAQFCEKDHGDRRLLAIRVQHDDQDYVWVVFPVPPTIGAQPTPLDTLREVCDRYGLTVSAREAESTFAESTFLIQVEVPGPHPFFSVKGRKEHEGDMGMACFMVRETQAGTTLVALAFQLDVSEILEDL